MQELDNLQAVGEATRSASSCIKSVISRLLSVPRREPRNRVFLIADRGVDRDNDISACDTQMQMRIAIRHQHALRSACRSERVA